MDEEQRKLERSSRTQGDLETEVKVLRSWLRSGLVDREIIELAALLGDLGCRSLLGMDSISKPSVTGLALDWRDSHPGRNPLVTNLALRKAAVALCLTRVQDYIKGFPRLQTPYTNLVSRVTQDFLEASDFDETALSELRETLPQDAEIEAVFPIVPAVASYIVRMLEHYSNNERFWSDFLIGLRHSSQLSELNRNQPILFEESTRKEFLNLLLRYALPRNNPNPRKSKIPKFLYHATYYPLLESLKSNGIGAEVEGKVRAWPFSSPGMTYLASSREEAESYAEISEEVPEEWLDEIIILKIPTKVLNLKHLRADSNQIKEEDEAITSFEYDLVIPWSSDIKVLRSNPDESRRNLERAVSQGDFSAYVKLLQLQLRLGEIREEILELVAYFGHHAAREVLGLIPRGEKLPTIVPLIASWPTTDQSVTNIPWDIVVRRSAIELGRRLLEDTLRQHRNLPSVRNSVRTALHYSGLFITDLPNIITSHQDRIQEMFDTLPIDGLSQAARLLLVMCLSYANNNAFWHFFIRFLTHIRNEQPQISLFRDEDKYNEETLNLWIHLILLEEQNNNRRQQNRHNPDESRRDLERQEQQDPGNLQVQANLIQSRIRSGELQWEAVEMAAQAGEPRASWLFPKTQRIIPEELFEAVVDNESLHNHLSAIRRAIDLLCSEIERRLPRQFRDLILVRLAERLVSYFSGPEEHLRGSFRMFSDTFQRYYLDKYFNPLPMGDHPWGASFMHLLTQLLDVQANISEDEEWFYLDALGFFEDAIRTINPLADDETVFNSGLPPGLSTVVRSYQQGAHHQIVPGFLNYEQFMRDPDQLETASELQAAYDSLEIIREVLLTSLADRPNRPNPDDNYRRDQQQAAKEGSPEAEAQVLQNALRTGKLRLEILELLARLDYPAARLLLPDASTTNLSDWAFDLAEPPPNNSIPEDSILIRSAYVFGMEILNFVLTTMEEDLKESGRGIVLPDLKAYILDAIDLVKQTLAGRSVSRFEILGFLRNRDIMYCNHCQGTSMVDDQIPCNPCLMHMTEEVSATRSLLTMLAYPTDYYKHRFWSSFVNFYHSSRIFLANSKANTPTDETQARIGKFLKSKFARILLQTELHQT